MRTPLSRHGASPAVRFLRETLLRSVEGRTITGWANRLAGGGIVREIGESSDLRRALPATARWIQSAGLWDAIPADERALLTAARLSAGARAAAVRATLDPLGRACAAEGVAPLLLKGTALHGSLYPDPADRPVSDADLYVPLVELEALTRAFSAAGFSPEPLTAARLLALDATGGREAALSDLVFRRDDGTGVPVEAKLDPVQIGLPLSRGERFREGAVPSAAYEGFVVPTPEAMAVQQALHLARHDGSDLTWFAELAEGVRRAFTRGEFDPRRALSLVDGEGLAGALRAVFASVEDVFPGSIPAGLRRGAGRAGLTPMRLRARVARAGPPDERAATWSLQAAHALSAGRPSAVLSALVRRALPHRAYLAARLGVPEGSRPAWVLNLRRIASLAAGGGHS